MLFKPYFAFLSHPVLFQTFSSLFVILLSLTEIAFSCTLWRKAKRFLKFFKTLWRLFSSSSFIPHFIDPYFSSASHSSIRSTHTFCQQKCGLSWSHSVYLWEDGVPFSNLPFESRLKFYSSTFQFLGSFQLLWFYLWHLTPCTSKLWNHWKINILTRYL